MEETELTQDEANDLLGGDERDARMGCGRGVRAGPVNAPGVWPRPAPPPGRFRARATRRRERTAARESVLLPVTLRRYRSQRSACCSLCGDHPSRSARE